MTPNGSPAPAISPDNQTQNQTWTYTDFAARAERLLEPLAALMAPGASHLPIEGPPSDHGEPADRFEAFARPMLLTALWLHSTKHTDEADRTLDPEPIARWFREGLVLGTDPTQETYWGVLPSFHQFAVEMAILVMALDIAEDHLWTPLTPAQKKQVAGWLAQIRGHAGHHNNHLFFDLLVLEFLGDQGFGVPEDRPCIDWLFAELETMYRGEGWFIDGTNENYDHYNAYAFHIYGLYWARRHGSHNPERAERWKQWAAQFLPSYARFFSARGEPLPFGRSLTYRFNGVGVFPLAADLGIDTLDPGAMRRLCRKCIAFFTDRGSGQRAEQSQGCMSIGWTDEFHGIAEPYSCAGSPYWAAKGLLMLTLEPDHAFFTAPEQPIPSETDAAPTVIAAPGYVIRNITTQTPDTSGSGGLPGNTGDIELINAGGWCSFSAAQRFGQYKWGRIAYRTGIGSRYTEQPSVIPPDAALTASRPESPETRFGRHKTIPLEVTADHLAAAYTLSAPKSGFNVSVVTRAFWKGSALMLMHRVRCEQPIRMTSGGFALASPTLPETHADPAIASASVTTQAQASSVRGLAGWTDATVIVRTAEEHRQHLYEAGDATPLLEADLGVGTHHLAEVLWTGRTCDADPCWSLKGQEGDRWHLQAADGSTWEITAPSS